MNTSISQEKTTPKKIWHKGISSTSLGWQLALPIVGGAFLGYQLDKTSPDQYLYTLIFILFGIIVGYYNIYKIVELEWLRTNAAKRSSHTKDQAQ